MFLCCSDYALSVVLGCLSYDCVRYIPFSLPGCINLWRTVTRTAARRIVFISVLPGLSILWKGSFYNWIFVDFSVNGRFRRVKYVRNRRKYIFVDGPSPFFESGSVKLEKYQSNKKERGITLGSRRPYNRAKWLALTVTSSTLSQ